MGFTKSTKDIKVHQKLGDYPRVDDGITAEDLKRMYDEPAETLQNDLNNLVDELGQISSASNIGANKLDNDDISNSNVQAKIEEVNKRLKDVSLGQIPNGSITEEKLDEELVKSLAKKNGELQENLNAQLLEGKSVEDLQGLFKGTVLTGTFTLTSTEKILDIELGFKPHLVIVYGEKNNDSSSVAVGNGTTSNYHVPRIITESYSTDYSKINENGFKFGTTTFYSSAITQAILYYIAIKL